MLCLCVIRKGKLRGGKLRQVPTDLSGVLDFLDRSTWHGRSVLGAHSQVLNKEIIGLASHPGALPSIAFGLAWKLLCAPHQTVGAGTMHEVCLVDQSIVVQGFF